MRRVLLAGGWCACAKSDFSFEEFIFLVTKKGNIFEYVNKKRENVIYESELVLSGGKTIVSFLCVLCCIDGVIWLRRRLRRRH